MKNKRMYYGGDCDYCEAMLPLIQRLFEEEGIEIEMVQVDNNKNAQQELEIYDKGRCEGIPFFIDTQSDKWLCGEIDYDELKEWALI